MGEISLKLWRQKTDLLWINLPGILARLDLVMSRFNVRAGAFFRVVGLIADNDVCPSCLNLPEVRVTWERFYTENEKVRHGAPWREFRFVPLLWL